VVVGTTRHETNPLGVGRANLELETSRYLIVIGNLMEEKSEYTLYVPVLAEIIVVVLAVLF
jgi:hypothetical protein